LEVYPVFKTVNLCKKFDNGVTVLEGIDIEIYSGECLVIAGANGCGKTVLSYLLTGLLEPTSGKILFMGKNLSESRSVLRRSVGLVFQEADAQLIGETVEEDIRFGPENLKLPKEEIQKRLNYCINTFNLGQKKDYSPRRLSGGEKRRLALAGILAMGCNTVIMDEPFANLDWPGVIQVLKLVVELKDNKFTTVILTHELEKILALADRLMILAGGRIQACGKPSDVLDVLDPSWAVRNPCKQGLKIGDCTWL